MDDAVASTHPNEAFEYEEAVERMTEWLDHPPRPGSLDYHEFEEVLERIARYLPPSPRISAAAHDIPAMGEDLERRIRAALSRRAHAASEQHWEPMVGGDVRAATAGS
jgi:hypothetical protein